ncbi:MULTISPECIES: helix-turn-helix transcriptional regulator [Leuconostoc]|jgi:transcriptional regulator with XRE-family HTH domain|uniref:Transcriptional regulator n=4 Tax=Leuconostoc TaxID=1243 RepID=A0A1X0VBB1_LEUPS|nr:MULTISPECIES: helix-turn-helix transcriptional regulator [Leuconostoc]KDA47298.1 putative transcriptional regulator [Leuconostoc pseudomesenteroides 1159]KDA49435.1 putative transcriptional regulator [Leuconostoc pseudomesenteroides PS12]CCJ66418.1 transcriptional regulator, putative [Leuconostoc pseudomesenteroides 4882]KAA8323715.1 helix-turn-helix transcriptional regulator [Leuconostoc carnosum]MCT3049683.1 XRE family transcriptional regulator [Leuconostoc mesenteroides]
MLIGVKIKMIREAFDLTQEQLGKELHLTRQTISSWENGKSYPGITDILSISNKYNVSLDELMKEDIELIEHFETIDHSLNKQKILYAIAYVANALFLLVSIFSNYMHVLPIYKVTALIIGMIALFVLFSTVQQPVNLYTNKWALLAIVTAFMYFLSIAIFKGVTSTNIDEQAGIYISAGLRVLLLTSSVYFIPQLPLRK